MPAQKEMKIVGRRKRASGLEAMEGLLKLVITLRGNQPFAPRGLYRFHSHEEADEWQMKMLTRASVDPRR